MKRILSERNFAAILFVLVLLAFSFAHEDSKKKDPQYQSTTPGMKSPAQLTESFQHRFPSSH